MSKDVYEHIKTNNRKTIFLICLLPIILATILFLLSWAFISLNDAVNILYSVLPVLLIICLIWTIISYCCGSKMMLGFAGATELNAKTESNKKVLHSVENIALAAGIPTPKVYIINDDSLNAFATGNSPENACIALTSGIIKKLEPLELQAVIAHEMGHIKNRDIRLDVIIITCIGALTLLADLIARILFYNIGGSSRDDDNAQASIKLILIIVWATLLVFNVIFAPIIYFSISRTREYQADASSVHITRNPDALISALKKISTDSRVEALDKCKLMGHVCIANPTEKSKQFAGIGETHPSIEKRINRLRSMK